MNFAMANLSLKEMGNFAETANRADLFPYLPKGIFPSELGSFGKSKEKLGIPFWGWPPCLFPSKTCC
jgi:hypothetical protein